MQKICTRCPEKGPQPIDNFHRCRKNPTALWHYHSMCKLCSAANQRKYKKTRPSRLDIAHILMESKRKRVKQGQYNHNGVLIPFSIGVADVKTVLARQTIDNIVRCAVTHVELSLDSKHPHFPSIDRIDNDRGYEPDNIRITTRFYNIARNTWSDNEVAAALDAITTARSTR